MEPKSKGPPLFGKIPTFFLTLPLVFFYCAHVLFHFFIESFYIESLIEEVLKGIDSETLETVLEKPKPCRWRDPGKYYRWSGEMLINDEGNFLTLELSDLHQKGQIKIMIQIYLIIIHV